MTDDLQQGQSPSTPATWESLGLTEKTLESIRKSGFKYPTPIQAQSIPLAIDGHDLIASSQTGTGKTASFVLPMVDVLGGRQGTLGLILSPTREIAQQSQATFEMFGADQGLKSVVLIGGIDMKIDAQALSTYPQVIVATPGRLCDHLERGNIWLEYIEWVVLDEADRMLDMGFADQLNRIMKEIPNSAQKLVFSATIPPMVEKIANKFLHNPKHVRIGKPMSAAKTVTQNLIWMREESKNRELMKLLEKEKGTIIVFTRSKDGASQLWRSLHSRNVLDATVIHSDKRQSDREQALADFKEGKFRILIATDVAGRGIHVDGVAHVINYDLPKEPEDYIHRIGRTGRTGAEGKATSFATSRDRPTVARIEKLLRHPIPSFILDPLPSQSSSNFRHSKPHSNRHPRRPTRK
ncbi:DEAD/DEAH box helicase [bacterium]|jgi:ATP-dependent RNA helicase RhlE|nr:DEAD/DEAH box helicase [bacterium]